MKKAIAIISIVLVTLLVAVTVILAVISKTFYNPITNYEDISFIRVYKGDGHYQDFYKNSVYEEKEVYNKIEKLHKESLKENLLSSLFQSALSFDGGIKEESITGETFNENLKSNTYIEINYLTDHAQKLTYNGKTFYDEDGDEISYTKLIIQVVPKTSMEEVVAYVIKPGTSGFKTTSAYNIRFLAHQNELYEYIQTLDLIPEVA